MRSRAYDSPRRSARLLQRRVPAVQRQEMHHRARILANLDFGARSQAHDLVGRHVLDQAHIAAPQRARRRLAARQPDLANTLDRRFPGCGSRLDRPSGTAGFGHFLRSQHAGELRRRGRGGRRLPARDAFAWRNIFTQPQHHAIGSGGGADEEAVRHQRAIRAGRGHPPVETGMRRPDRAQQPRSPFERRMIETQLQARLIGDFDAIEQIGPPRLVPQRMRDRCDRSGRGPRRSPRPAASRRTTENPAGSS